MDNQDLKICKEFHCEFFSLKTTGKLICSADQFCVLYYSHLKTIILQYKFCFVLQFLLSNGDHPESAICDHLFLIYTFNGFPWLKGTMHKDCDYTFKVDPFGPINLCLLFTNLSLVATRPPILIISQKMSSSNTRSACKHTIHLQIKDAHTIFVKVKQLRTKNREN